MILIFGGAYQGKLAYAQMRFKLTESNVYKCGSDNPDMPKNKKIIYEIDKWILALVKNEMNVEDAVQQFSQCNQDSVVICNDISSGVVPSDPVLRKWREETGRAMAVLSQKSSEVFRLFCGISTRIK